MIHFGFSFFFFKKEGIFALAFTVSFDFDLILLDLQKGRNLIQSFGDELLHIMIWADMYGSVMVKFKKKYTVILQIFGALKFRWRAIAERSV